MPCWNDIERTIRETGDPSLVPGRVWNKCGQLIWSENNRLHRLPQRAMKYISSFFNACIIDSHPLPLPEIYHVCFLHHARACIYIHIVFSLFFTHSQSPFFRTLLLHLLKDSCVIINGAIKLSYYEPFLFFGCFRSCVGDDNVYNNEINNWGHP